MDESYLTQEQLADRWKMKVRTLNQWRWRGRGPVYTKIGKGIYYWVQDVKAYEMSQRRRSTSGLPMEPDTEDEDRGGRITPTSSNVFPLMRRKKGGR